MMSTRRIAGIVMGVSGVLISIWHLVAVLFSDAPERDHQHEAIVLVGFALAVLGLLLIGKDRRQQR